MFCLDPSPPAQSLRSGVARCPPTPLDWDGDAAWEDIKDITGRSAKSKTASRRKNQGPRCVPISFWSLKGPATLLGALCTGSTLRGLYIYGRFLTGMLGARAPQAHHQADLEDCPCISRGLCGAYGEEILHSRLHLRTTRRAKNGWLAGFNLRGGTESGLPSSRHSAITEQSGPARPARSPLSLWPSGRGSLVTGGGEVVASGQHRQAALTAKQNRSPRETLAVCASLQDGCLLRCMTACLAR